MFWNSSFSEVIDKMESYKRVQKAKTKEKILFIYQLAEWMSEHMAAKLDKECTASYPWDKYPELFAEEQHMFEEQKQREELEVFKERRRQYYNFKNSQRASADKS